MAKIEAIINTRPLTKTNLTDISEIPLRPVDFLQGNMKFSLPCPDTLTNDDEEYDPDLIQTAKQAKEALESSERIATEFWERWSNEYLLCLRDSQKQHLKQKRHVSRNVLEVGEIVLISDDFLPRGSWSFGKVCEIITSADDLVRSAKVLLPNRKILHRPLNRLYPLEIRSSEIPALPKPVERITDTPRVKLERKSKNRAYKVIREFENNLEDTQDMILSNMFGRTAQERYSILPYQTTDVKIMNFTAVTVQMPSHSPMSKTYAQSETETIILPDSFQIPVVCSTRYEAQANFKRCDNKMTCSCSSGTSPHICECGRNSIGHIRPEESNRLPLKTGTIEMYTQGNDVVVNSFEEVTLYVRSKIMAESSELVTDNQCTAQLSELKEIKCSNFTTVVKCSPSNTTKELSLNFNRAFIKDICYIACGQSKSEMLLEGHLFYHPVANDSVFFHNSEEGQHMDLSDVSAMLDQTDNASSPSNAAIMAALEHVVGRLHTLRQPSTNCSSGQSRDLRVFSALWQITATDTIRRGATAFLMRLQKVCRWQGSAFVVVASRLLMTTRTVVCSAQRVGDHTMCYCAPTEDKAVAASNDDDHEDDTIWATR
ncbi:hypothetical protein V3C99_018610 [Haemonchus contortus]|uniref:DUF5641 domain-containing protein n=1 Tax=Haemonchus contortus TaxID=6289 RepID=A0A7I4Z0D2_HAECO